MSRQTDLLVLGATGFTGKLVTRQLNEHRDRSKFTFSVAARSKSKLDALVKELDLSAQIPVLYVDVTKQNEVEAAVKTAKVVINAVGPYWIWGSLVVQACVRNGVHYVDLTGETPWIREIIKEFDFLATKNRTIIIPSCGYDSIPSDLSVYLSVKVLKDRLGPETEIGPSVSAHKLKAGVSFGSLSSLYTYLAEIPRYKTMSSLNDHYLSPSPGAPSPPHKLVYSLPYVYPPVVGGIFVMGQVNRAVVQRTRGLLEICAGMRSLRYGPKFSYEEFAVQKNRLVSAVVSFFLLSVGFCLANSKIALWAFKRLVIDRWQNPTEKEMEKGYLKLTNITSTASQPPFTAKTLLRIQGDPGYLCTSMMLAECALALLEPSKLTPLAKEGGILTAVSALGDELPKRLEKTGRFEFQTSILPQ
ncbi:hypothetical protein M422DRAFT_223745 [Sphaerobolus stellatus SS14]|nr:hypothetical protein M422DRAFT_223745 [Sphaerobolus stellatus SS14]